MAWTRELPAELPLWVRRSPFAFLLTRAPLVGCSARTLGATRGKRSESSRYSAGAELLTELDGDIRVAVGGHHPRRAHVVVWTEDVGAVTGAVHEHLVERPNVCASPPPPDVLASLVPQARGEIDIRSIGVGDEALAGHAVGVADRNVVEARAPGQGAKSVGGAILADQRLLRRSDNYSGRRRPGGRRRCGSRRRWWSRRWSWRFRRWSGFWDGSPGRARRIVRRDHVVGSGGCSRFAGDQGMGRVRMGAHHGVRADAECQHNNDSRKPRQNSHDGRRV